MYDVYLGKILLPVTPSKIQLKIKNQNKTMILINEGEVNLLKQAGLTEISFQIMLPQSQYPFAKYKSGFQSAAFFLDELERLKTERSENKLVPFRLIISRATPNGKNLFDNNITVSLEDYTINEEASNGLDLMVDIRLKQYRAYGTKELQVVQKPNSAPQASIQKQRPAENPPKAKTYTVVSGDSLWAIAQRYLNNGNRYNEIYTLNQSIIDARNKGTGNPKFTIYPGQTFTLPAP